MAHERWQLKSGSEPAQVSPEQQGNVEPQLAPSALQVSSQIFALSSASGLQAAGAQSLSSSQSVRQVSVSALCPAQIVPSQQVGRSGPQGCAAGVHEQYRASAQKPVVLLENGTQQPVSGQSSSVVQVGRQPAKSGLSDSTQAPRQQSLGVVLLPGVQASPRFLQGFVQSSRSEQIGTPMSKRSVQQPVLHSESSVHSCTQPLLLPTSMHDSPSQQAFVAQLLPSPTQSPARALGLEQLGVAVPASPVQKQDACSNVMQV